MEPLKTISVENEQVNSNSNGSSHLMGYHLFIKAYIENSLPKIPEKRSLSLATTGLTMQKASNEISLKSNYKYREEFKRAQRKNNFKEVPEKNNDAVHSTTLREDSHNDVSLSGSNIGLVLLKQAAHAWNRLKEKNKVRWMAFGGEFTTETHPQEAAKLLVRASSVEIGIQSSLTQDNNFQFTQDINNKNHELPGKSIDVLTTQRGDETLPAKPQGKHVVERKSNVSGIIKISASHRKCPSRICSTCESIDSAQSRRTLKKQMLDKVTGKKKNYKGAKKSAAGKRKENCSNQKKSNSKLKNSPKKIRNSETVRNFKKDVKTSSVKMSSSVVTKECLRSANTERKCPVVDNLPQRSTRKRKSTTVTRRLDNKKNKPSTKSKNNNNNNNTANDDDHNDNDDDDNVCDKDSHMCGKSKTDLAVIGHKHKMNKSFRKSRKCKNIYEEFPKYFRGREPCPKR